MSDFEGQQSEELNGDVDQSLFAEEDFERLRHLEGGERLQGLRDLINTKATPKLKNHPEHLKEWTWVVFSLLRETRHVQPEEFENLLARIEKSVRPPSKEEEAGAASNQVSQLLESNPYAQVGLVKTYWDNDRKDEAVQMAEGIVAQEPQNALMRRELAIIYNMLGRKQEAIKLNEEALEIDPNLPKVRSELSGYYSKAGEREKAIRILETAPTTDINARVQLAKIVLSYKTRRRSNKYS